MLQSSKILRSILPCGLERECNERRGSSQAQRPVSPSKRRSCRFKFCSKPANLPSQLIFRQQVTSCAASAGGCADVFLQNSSFEGDFMPKFASSRLHIPCPGRGISGIVLREKRRYRRTHQPTYLDFTGACDFCTSYYIWLLALAVGMARSHFLQGRQA